MRQFWLLSENTKDFIIDLQEKDAFGSAPDGLGIEVSASGYRAGTDIIYFNEQPSYQNAQFTMVFGSESQEPYAAFTTFMSKLDAQKLVLAYKPDDGAYDPELNFRPAYMYDDEDAEYPEYEIQEVGSTTLTKSIKKSYTLGTKATVSKKTWYRHTASDLVATDYASFTVKVAYNDFGTTNTKSFSFTTGTSSTKSTTLSKTTTKKKKKTTYKVTIKAAYNGSNQIIFSVHSNNKATKITTKKKITVTYDYSKPMTIHSILPDGDAADLPSESIIYEATPVNDIAAITINPKTYTTFSVQALYFLPDDVSEFISIGSSEFIVEEPQTYTVESSNGKFDISYDGNTTLTIESIDISTVINYKVTVNYADIELEEDVYTDEDLEFLNENIYFRKVKFVSATKGELEQETGWLLSDIQLSFTTPWFRWEPVDIPTAPTDSLPIDTTGCLLMSQAIKTVPLKLRYLVKQDQADGFIVNVQYYDAFDPTKKYTSEVKFDKMITAGSYIEINSDFEEFKARITSDNGVTWTDLLPFLSTSGVGFARVKANGISYLDVKGDNEVFNKNTDKLYYRKELIIV